MLKRLAVLFMVIDHIGHYLGFTLPSIAAPQDLYWGLRIIGRLAFPIFAYHVAVGFQKTSNCFQYFLRMLFFACLSEGIMLAGFRLGRVRNSGLNIMFTFALAIVCLAGCDLARKSWRDVVGRLQPITPKSPDEPFYNLRLPFGEYRLAPSIGLILGLIFFLLPFYAVWALDTEYGIYGLLTVCGFYWALGGKPVLRSANPSQAKAEPLWRSLIGSFEFRALIFQLLLQPLCFFASRSFSLDLGFSHEVQFYAAAATPLILMIPLPEKKPGRVEKYFFYIFYPTHVFILCLIRMILLRY